MIYAEAFWILAAALVLDRIVGEPAWLWSRLSHPVVLAGRAIAGADELLNRERDSPDMRRWLGILAMTILTGLAAATGFALHSLCAALPFGFIVEAAAVAVLLAQKSLVDHVRAVADALDRHGLEEGKRAVAMIVGRDLTSLDEAAACRAAVESLAENFSDGLVAPAFWYATLGLPGLLAYKLANIADSMIGHRTPRHAAFGWAGARLDDVLNLIPARLSALLIAAGALLTQDGARTAARAALSDASQHKSPNAGWPEAAMAGALGLAFGGPRRYRGTFVDGAWLNAGGRREATSTDIRRALRLADAAWVVLLALVVIAALASGR